MEVIKIAILDKAIEIAHRTDLYRAMRTVLDMINELTDTQLSAMTVMLRSHKQEIENFCEINSYYVMSATAKNVIGIA